MKNNKRKSGKIRLKVIKKMVYEYPTKYKEGFMTSEIEDFIIRFDNLNLLKFSDALDGIHSMILDGNVVLYRQDIVVAIRLGLEHNIDYRFEF